MVSDPGYIGFVRIMRSGRALTLLFLLLLVGCSAKKTVWSRSGASDAQFKQDSYNCEEELPITHCQSWACMVADDKLNSLYRACMQSKGWEPREVPE